MKPHNRERRTRGRSWNCHQLELPPAEGSVSPDLPCLVCHCSERRVLIVGEDVREHGLKLTPPPGHCLLFLGWPKRERRGCRTSL